MTWFPRLAPGPSAGAVAQFSTRLRAGWLRADQAVDDATTAMASPGPKKVGKIRKKKQNDADLVGFLGG